MADKPNGGALSKSGVQSNGQGGYPSIEDLAGQARARSQELQNFKDRAVIPARELRQMWNSRVRPFWRLNLSPYQALTRRLVELGENYLAIDTATEGIQFFGDDPTLILSQALASARCGAVDQAQRILSTNENVLSGAPEYLSLLGRTHKDLWKLSGDPRELEESYRSYYQDYLLEKKRAPARAPFPGANAASMALVLGKIDIAQTVAKEVLTLVGNDSSDYWQQVTRAECELVLGYVDVARERYQAAVTNSPQPYANLMTTRAQTRLVLPAFGLDANSFDSCFPIPRVACFSGHRVDEPTRKTPRFPVDAIDMVKDRIAEAVKRLGIGFGYSSAANGADILFLEVMQERGAGPDKQPHETYVNLPFDEADFIKTSVEHSSSAGWIERFRAVIEHATEVTHLTADLTGSGIAFEYANRLCIGSAAHKAKELDTELIMLAVWDGQNADRRGGTADMLRIAADAGTRIETISPHRSSEANPPYQLSSSRYSHPTEAADEAIVHALGFSVAAENQTAAADSIAHILTGHRPLAAEVYDRRYRFYFESARSAVAAATDVLASVAPHLERSLGLHSLPVTKRMHPVTGLVVFSPALAQKAMQLAELDPRGQIYATAGFTAFSEQEGHNPSRYEFLGHRALDPETTPEGIFRVVPPAKS